MKKRLRFVCFTGIDGSGKTTLAKKLTSFLKEKNLPAIYVYGRFKLIFTKPMVLFANKLFLKNHDISRNYTVYVNKKKALFRKHKIGAIFYLYALLADYLLQLLIKVVVPLLMGKIVVCDRYIYDTIITDIAVDMNLSRGQVISLIDKCFLFFPKPSITFIVDVPEHVAQSRKNDIPCMEYLKDRRIMYLELAKHYKMTMLDGKKKPEEVFLSCVEALKNEFDL